MAKDPFLGNVLLAIVCSNLPRNERLVLESVVSWGSYSDWKPRFVPIDKIASRSALCRRNVCDALIELQKRGLLVNRSIARQVPEWEIRIDAVLALPESHGAYAGRAHSDAWHARSDADSAQASDADPAKSDAFQSRPDADPAKSDAEPAYYSQDLTQDLNPRSIPRENKGASTPQKKRPSANAGQTETPLPDFIASHKASAAWGAIYETLKPAERDRLLLAMEVKDAFNARNPNIRSAALTTSTYRAFRNLMKPFSDSAGLKTCLEAIDGAHKHDWTIQTRKAGEWAWIFRDTNLEKFAALSRERPGNTGNGPGGFQPNHRRTPDGRISSYGSNGPPPRVDRTPIELQDDPEF